MELNDEEKAVLESIEEGMSDLSQAEVYTSLDRARVKQIFEKLEHLGLIKINKKYDSFYKEDYWDAEIIRK